MVNFTVLLSTVHCHAYECLYAALFLL